ncbi:hypothetical protein QOT17_025346 [Balamuthia mandrillaris]
MLRRSLSSIHWSRTITNSLVSKSMTEALPAELWLEVFAHLGTMEDLCSLAQVCHQFAALSREDLLWQPLACPSWLPDVEDEEAGEAGNGLGSDVTWCGCGKRWRRGTPPFVRASKRTPNRRNKRQQHKKKVNKKMK